MIELTAALTFAATSGVFWETANTVKSSLGRVFLRAMCFVHAALCVSLLMGFHS